MLRFSIVLIFFACQTILSAQCKLNIRCFSEENHEEVDASVGLNLLEIAAVSALSQNTLSLECGKPYTIFVLANDYAIDSFEISLKRDTSVIIYLKSLLSSLPVIEIYANRLPGKVLPAISELNAKDISTINTGKDLPFLLESLPSTVSTSDAGNQVGYTALRIRGSDQTRINVTLNGVPVNDAESSTVFWVDLPDLASSVDKIQIQRGVGTSSFGAGSFGANINILTSPPVAEAYFKTNIAAGSFNTIKQSYLFGTGILNKHFSFEGRLSSISSDGYVDRAKSVLKSLNGTLNYIGSKTVARFIVFSGNETTYQSWYGVPESVLSGDTSQMLAYAERNGLSASERQNLLNSGRTYNYYQYKDQNDQYLQNYYQFIYSRQLTSQWLLSAVAHWTKGKGNYEEWRPNDLLANYKLSHNIVGIDTIYNANIVRKRWLDNDFYGGNVALKYESDKLYFTTGITAYQYNGKHYGEISWIDNYAGLAPGYRYYNGTGNQSDKSVFAKLKYKIRADLQFFTDLQYRAIDYKIGGSNNDLLNFDITTNYRFFNPKIGLSFQKNGWVINTSLGQSNNQAFRDDFINAALGNLPKPEHLTDFEIEFQKNEKNWSARIGFYFMKYKDQLVLTGALNDVGAALRTNVSESSRKGIEMEAGWRINKYLKWNGNLTLSQNVIDDFGYVLYDYENGGTMLTDYKNTPISFSPSVIAYTDIEAGYKAFKMNFNIKHVGKQFLDNTGQADKSLKAYTICNASIAWNKNVVNVGNIGLKFQLYNVFDLKYSSNGYTYSYIYGQTITENFYYPQAGRNFMVACSLSF